MKDLFSSDDSEGRSLDAMNAGAPITQSQVGTDIGTVFSLRERVDYRQ